MTDIDHATELPQPDRGPLDLAPQEPTEVAEEAAETPQERSLATKRVGMTYARQMDERARTLLDRIDAFVRELEAIGVDDLTTPRAGVKGDYQEALGYIGRARDEVALVKERTAHVKDVFDNL